MKRFADSWRKRAFEVALLLLFFPLVALIWPRYSPLLVTVRQEGGGEVFQVRFKKSLAARYDPADVKTALVVLSGTEREFSATLPAGEVGVLRFDPLTEPGEVRLRRICLKRLSEPSVERCWSGGEIARDFIARDHIVTFSPDADAVRLVNIGTDPFFETKPELEHFLRFFARESGGARVAAVLALMIFSCVLVLCPLESRRWRIPAFAAVLLCSSAAFYRQTEEIRLFTPPLQGPDENEHAAKLIAFELGKPCGELPRELAALWTDVKMLPHHPERKILALSTISDDRSTFIRQENPTCAYGDVPLVLPALFNKLMGNDSSSRPLREYLFFARRSVTFSALLCFLAPLAIAVRGRPLRNESEERTDAYRAAGLLTVFYFAFLPQTLWISSTLGQDWLLIPAGVVMALSTFLRIQFVSDILIMLSLAAASTKGVYLAPFGFLAFAHYGTRFGTRRTVTLLSLVALGGLAVTPFVLRFYCRENYCYGLSGSGILVSFDQFAAELIRIVSEYRVLSLPWMFHAESAFGNFGWLDTPMASRFAKLYSYPVSWLLLFGAIGLAVQIVRRDISEFRSLSSVSILGATYWLISLFAVYAIVHVMMHWCGEGAPFGCGYQRRYELPMYPFLLSVFIFLGVRLVTSTLSDSRQRLLPGLFLVLLIAQMLAARAAAMEQISVIRERYHFHEVFSVES